MHGYTVRWVWSKVQVLQLSEKRDGPQPDHGVRPVLNRDIDNLKPRMGGPVVHVSLSFRAAAAHRHMTARLFRG